MAVDDGIPDDEELGQIEAAERFMRAVELVVKAAKLPIRELTVAAGAEGIVALSGVTRFEAAKRRADDIARAVPGIVEVLNTITVLGGPGTTP